jgi:hypothetical protein
MIAWTGRTAALSFGASRCQGTQRSSSGGRHAMGFVVAIIIGGP